MKKEKGRSRKLVLAKQTLRILQPGALHEAAGGFGATVLCPPPTTPANCRGASIRVVCLQ